MLMRSVLRSYVFWTAVTERLEAGLAGGEDRGVSHSLACVVQGRGKGGVEEEVVAGGKGEVKSVRADVGTHLSLIHI